jgi:hypothetical protein
VATLLTQAEAAALVAERMAERDRIQANLFELDASFGKRLLSGASLAGTTKVRWQAASADLAWLWEVFAAYSAVVERAAELRDGKRRPAGGLAADLRALLTGPSVTLKGDHVPLARRQLTVSGEPEEQVTLTEAVERMTRAFGRITDVTAAAETVWNEVSDRLDQAASVLGQAVRQADDIIDDALTGAGRGADADLRRMRDLLSTDPLALWHDDGVDLTGPDQLRHKAQAVAKRMSEISRLVKDADRRITEVGNAVADARAREHDARAAYDQAAGKVVAVQLPVLPAETASLAERLAGLAAVRSAGRWQQLATDLAAIENAAAAAAEQWSAAGLAAQAPLYRRSELRGLLDAYQAKANQLGASEDALLTGRYQAARDLLWTAPCDLAAAEAAVRSYQDAVITLQGRTS